LSEKSRCTGLTIVLLSLNHARFIRDSLGSIAAAFPKKPTIVHIDAGSTDGTPDSARAIAKDLQLDLIQSAGRWTTMQSLGAANRVVKTPWAVLLSADDYLHPTYGSEALNVLARAKPTMAFNADLQVVDKSGTAIGRSFSKWTSSNWLNRRLLCASNPGRAPGTILPWEFLRKQGFFQLHQHSTIEDYLLWTELVRYGQIRRARNLTASYRIHSSNASGEDSSLDYAASLGYAGGWARQTVVQSIDLPAHIRLMRKWLRSLPEDQHKAFAEGYDVGRTAIR